MSNPPTWLNDLYAAMRKSSPDEAIDILLENCDELLARGKFEACASVLRAIDLSRLDTTLLFAMLSVIRPILALGTPIISARVQLDVEATQRAIETEIHARVPERAERLLRGFR